MNDALNNNNSWLCCGVVFSVHKLIKSLHIPRPCRRPNDLHRAIRKVGQYTADLCIENSFQKKKGFHSGRIHLFNAIISLMLFAVLFIELHPK